MTLDDKAHSEHHDVDSKYVDRLDVPHVADTEAAAYLDPTVVVTEEDNKRLRRMIDKRVLPLLCLGYLCQALDKGTLSSSSIMGWLDHVHAHGQDFALTTTMLWCGIIIGEPLANQGVRRFPFGKFLSGGIVIWSVLVLGLGFAMRVPPILAIRFLLGFFESLIGPVLLAVMVQWYRVDEQPTITTYWQCMLGTANIITSLLAYGFYHLPSKAGSLHSWQWLHITIALISAVCSVIIFLFLPDSPTRARWASEADKKLLVERVRCNNQGLRNPTFNKVQAKEAITDSFTWCLFALAVGNTMVVGGIGTFGGLLINRAFGFTVLEAQLLNIPIGVISILSFLLMGFLVRKTKETLLCMIGFTIPNIVGTIVLLTVAPGGKSKGGLVFAYYMMQLYGACYPAILMLLARNSAGQTKRSITYAVTFIGWAGGNAISPQIFQSKWAPRYFNSLYIHLAMYACFIALCVATRTLLVRRNRAKVAAQSELGLGSDTDLPKNIHAFDDLTDIQNPDFRYSI